MDRILVVDDDLLILQALTRILEKEGYAVVAHHDPHQALHERGFAVVVTDFMMPQLSGVELLQRLREANPDAARLLLTAAADFRVASEAVNRGEVFRLLSKPWSIPELVACVRQAVTHHHLITENRRLALLLREQNETLALTNTELERRLIERTQGLLEGLVAALDQRDTETQWHSRRVALFARRLAEAMGVQGDALDVVERGALLHDIGKIGVKDSILHKPGPLTPEEWTQMRLHPELGHRMLAKVPFLSDVAAIVLQHQERWDGRGYPQGLAGEAIVLGARVFAVVDTLDAITSDRPYRAARSYAVARDEIARCAGTQFDPAVVREFLALPEEAWDAIRGQVERLEAEDLAALGRHPATAPEGCGAAVAAATKPH